MKQRKYCLLSRKNIRLKWHHFSEKWRNGEGEKGRMERSGNQDIRRSGQDIRGMGERSTKY